MKGKVTLETSSVMKHYVKESSLGRQMTLMGDVKCCINMLDFIGGGGDCSFRGYKGQQNTP